MEESCLGILVILVVDVIYGMCIVFLILLGEVVSFELELVECIVCVMVVEVIVVGLYWMYVLVVDIVCD